MTAQRKTSGTTSEEGTWVGDAGGADGVQGNARLTAVTGVVLLVLFAVEVGTVVDVERFITPHVVVGVALVGPVLLKIASTLYRFVRYYTGSRPYRHKGPPHIVLRVLGPVVIASSLAVLGTGFGLLAVRPDQQTPLLDAHRVSYVVWGAAISIHVLGHVRTMGRLSWRELRDPLVGPAARRHRLRLVAVILAVLVGAGAAAVILPVAKPWTNYPRAVPRQQHNPASVEPVNAHPRPHDPRYQVPAGKSPLMG